MPNSHSRWQSIVSGKRRGVAAGAIRGVCRALTPIYRIAVYMRNQSFEWWPSQVYGSRLPVVSVGNITVGGTGKTPLVAWLVHWFQENQITAAVLSRGYGSTAGGVNDEALELAQRCPGLIQWQDPDRVALARRAESDPQVDLLILDDGFQHRRLARDLNLVLIDATQPFGFDRLLPRGLLREPLSALRRADLIVLTRTEQVDRSSLETTRSRLQEIAPSVPVVETRLVVRKLLNTAGQTEPIEVLRQGRWLAFSGIGNPANFQKTLEQAGTQLVDFRCFPDHHLYTDQDRAELLSETRRRGADHLICTGKDLVKFSSACLAEFPLWSLVVEYDFVGGMQPLEDRLQRVIQSCSQRRVAP